MGPYTLTVFNAGSRVPVEVAHAKRAPEVLEKIAALLKAHEGCERIRVESMATHLFTVDCHGDRIEE